MTLSDKFHELQKQWEFDSKIGNKIADLINNAPESSERDGLMSLMYHEGIGYPIDLEKSFELAERAIDGGDPLGYFMLGFMIDNIETPDQANSGPRQKYDHYDAERFYAKCAELESRWRPFAILWLGDYYLDFARGGDPEVGVDYYESIAEHNAEAATALSNYYWDLIMPEYFEDAEWQSKLFKWTSVAAELNPADFSYRMGWIYADGLGCEQSYSKALDFFKTAYSYGDLKGAEAIAKIYEEKLENEIEADSDLKATYAEKIAFWKKRADNLT